MALALILAVIVCQLPNTLQLFLLCFMLFMFMIEQNGADGYEAQDLEPRVPNRPCACRLLWQKETVGLSRRGIIRKM